MLGISEAMLGISGQDASAQKLPDVCNSPLPRHKGYSDLGDGVSTAAPSPAFGDALSPWPTPSTPTPTFAGWGHGSPAGLRDRGSLAKQIDMDDELQSMNLTLPLGLLLPSKHGDNPWSMAEDHFLSTSTSKPSFVEFMAGFSEPPPVVQHSKLSHCCPSIYEEESGCPFSISSPDVFKGSIASPIESSPLPLPVQGAAALPEYDGASTPPPRSAAPPSCFVTPATRRPPTSPPGAPARGASKPCDLMKALCNRSLEEVEAALLADRDAAEGIFLDSFVPPLSYAIQMKCGADIVAELLRHGASVDAMDRSGRTPLMKLAQQRESIADACIYGDTRQRTLAVAELLTNAGADPFADRCGCRPVDVALAAGSLHLYDAWISGNAQQDQQESWS